MVAQLADIAGNLDALRAVPMETTGEVPWPAVLEALRALQATPHATAAAAAPAPAPDIGALLATMQGQQAPVIEILRATLARQDMLNSALLELAEVLARAPSASAPAAAAGGAAPADSEGKAARRNPPRVRTQREIAFERELEKLRFKHEADGKDGAQE
jgi:hypothetical protein